MQLSQQFTPYSSFTNQEYGLTSNMVNDNAKATQNPKQSKLKPIQIEVNNEKSKLFVKHLNLISPTQRALEQDPKINFLLHQIQTSGKIYELNNLPLSARNRDLRDKQTKIYQGLYTDIRKEISNQIQTKAQNLFQISDKNRSENNLFKFNRFTESDGRYRDIINLKIENTQLKNEIEQLKQHIQEIDEFKLVMENEQLNDQNQFSPKRILLLKAQIKRQQRYITQLTSFLKQSRKEYLEVKKVISYLLQVLNQYGLDKEKQLLKEQLHEEKSQDNENTLLKTIDHQSNVLALKNILSLFLNNEDRDNFVRNFNLTYQKIVEYERENIEFKDMFILRNSKTEGTKVKYTHPIKKFLQSYQNQIPIYSVFEGFPIQEKQTATDMLITLQGMLSKIDHGYKKIKTFEVFKGNQFLFKQGTIISLPDMMLEKPNGFLDYLQVRDQIRLVSLNYQILSQSEQNLQDLMERLIIFQSEYIINNKNTYSPDIDQMISHTRTCIEDLLNLGCLINSDNILTNQKIIVATQDILKQFPELYEEVMNKYLRQSSVEHKKLQKQQTNQLQVQTQQLSAQAQLQNLVSNLQQVSQRNSPNQSPSHSQNQSESQIQNGTQNDIDIQNEEKKEVETFFSIQYLNEETTMKEYMDKFRFFASLIDDLGRQIWTQKPEQLQKIIAKLSIVNFKLQHVFEMKSNLILLKDQEISYLRNSNTVLRQEVTKLKEFVFEIQKKINNFFNPLKQQIDSLSYSFNFLFSKDKQSMDPSLRKQHYLQFKKYIREIQLGINLVLEKDVESNQLNLKNLKTQFLNQYNLYCQRFEKIQKHLTKPVLQ